MNLLQRYNDVRSRTEAICQPLQTEDYVVQPIVDVSPPKWHIGHTTWFFETFVLNEYHQGYRVFNADFNFVFNSYYETVGARVIRTDRGNLSRPTVDEVYQYRKHVDQAMNTFLANEITPHAEQLVELGLNHEEQHQELLWTDLKYILGNNPLFPAYVAEKIVSPSSPAKDSFNSVPEGLYDIGAKGKGFCFDNELNPHKVFLDQFAIASSLVTNAAYLDFINDGGYKDFSYWHSEGWEWVKANQVTAPMYWHWIDEGWHQYTLAGLQLLDRDEALCHISYYEASAFAAWKGMRLPTEFEWEAASHLFKWGQRWEWTSSAYLPYPGFTKAPGAIGEYNGKFMVNQMVMRGASEVTSPGHSRATYRNFFHPQLRWQYTGIRLAK
jgi:ergothioneine biosynthesis protein EgtB